MADLVVPSTLTPIDRLLNIRQKALAASNPHGPDSRPDHARRAPHANDTFAKKISHTAGLADKRIAWSQARAHS